MRISYWSRRRGRRCVETPGREFDHGYNLFARQMEPLHNLVNGRANFQIVKDNRNRRPRVAEDPRSTALAGNTFHGGAMRPIESWHILTSVIVAGWVGFCYGRR
jgi:hypothetical protein